MSVGVLYGSCLLYSVGVFGRTSRVDGFVSITAAFHYLIIAFCVCRLIWCFVQLDSFSVAGDNARHTFGVLAMVSGTRTVQIFDLALGILPDSSPHCRIGVGPGHGVHQKDSRGTIGSESEAPTPRHTTKASVQQCTFSWCHRDHMAVFCHPSNYFSGLQSCNRSQGVLALPNLHHHHRNDEHSRGAGESPCTHSSLIFEGLFYPGVSAFTVHLRRYCFALEIITSDLATNSGSESQLVELIVLRQKVALRLMVLATACLVCFVLRVGMFLYRPVTQNMVSSDVTMVFGYFIPELLPTVTQLTLFLLRTPRPKSGRTMDSVAPHTSESTADIASLSNTASSLPGRER